MQNISNQQKKILALSLLGVATFYLIFVLSTGLDQFLFAAQSLGWTGWLLILTCSFTNYVLRFVRWVFYANTWNHSVSHWLHFNYYMSAFALTTTPGKAGETIRSVYLSSHGVPYNKSLAMFFTERFLDVIVISILATLSILSIDQYEYFIIFALLVLLTLLQIIRSPLGGKVLTYTSIRLPQGKIKSLLDYLILLLNSARELLVMNKLIPGMLFGFLAWSIQGLAFHFILQKMGINLDLAISMSIYAISLLAGAISFVPGGIGTTEAVMGLLLLQFNVDPAHAIAAPIISRISTLWFAVSLGLLSSTYLGYITPSKAEK
jgi:uncharacterized protein (TIRG00374 family)